MPEDNYSFEEIKEELTSQKEELSAAIEYLKEQNLLLEHRLQMVNQRNKELDALIYRMYHDLRSPITSSKGLINISKFITYEEFVNQITPGINIMEHNLNNMLDFAKSLFIDRIPDNTIPIKYLIKQIKLAFDYDISHEILMLEWNVEMEEDFEINESLKIALKQIISNSIQFKKEKDVLVEIEIKKGSNDTVNIRIKDNGIGMKPELTEKATDLFYRGTEHSKGSGIGLYIVKNIVEGLKGSIEIKSEPGKGFSILIVIPD